MLHTIAVAVGLFLMLLAGLEIGRWLRLRRPAGGESADGTAADGVVFAVLGLLIAFTFTASASRFDERRKLINDHANAIGTAWLRLDLLPEMDREIVRQKMREWVQTYFELTKDAANEDTIAQSNRVQKALQLQDDVWRAAINAVSKLDKPQLAGLVLSPINEWIDLSSTRMEMQNRGLPPIVLPTLAALAFAAAILAGFSMSKRSGRSVLHTFAFAGTIALMLYVIMDLNQPRSGLIRIDEADHAMMQVYKSMVSTAPAKKTD